MTPSSLAEAPADVAGAWSDLVAAALMGAGRCPRPAVDGGGPLRAALAAVPVGPVGAEGGGLLAAASVVAAYREAGRIVAVDPRPSPEPAPADVRLLPSDRATSTLASILEEKSYAPLLGEWLALAGAAGNRLPPELIPTVFDTVGAAARPAASALAGPLGAWLAARNEAWSWAVHAVPAPGGAGTAPADALEAAWGAEADERRQVALAALRAIDPDRARALVKASWANEPAAVRMWALAVLEAHLSPADEPLLEAALDDRRKDVRQQAARLLATLPGSRRAARMAARGVPLVRVEGRLRKRLTVDLPAEVDKAMLRDGVEAKPPRGGERRWWLLQVVAGTPLGAWTESLGRPPAELVALAHASDAGVLVEGWSAAAVSQRHATWAHALLDGGALPPGTDAALVGVLPGDEADRAVGGWLGGRDAVAVLKLMAGSERQWSAATSDAGVAALAAIVAMPSAVGIDLARWWVPALALRLHPSVGPAAVTRLTAALEAAPPKDAAAVRAIWERPIATFGSLLHFRHLLHEEFR